MAPKRKPPTKRTPPVTRGSAGAEDGSPDISQIVSEQIAAAIPKIVSQLSANINQNHGGTSNGTGVGGGGTVAGGTRAGGSATIVAGNNHGGCSYKTFMGCKPLEFAGTEGAVGVHRWIEKTESVLKISACAENQKVLYATCTFQGKALTWWNTEVRTRGSGNIDAMTWVQFKEILLAEYCPRNEVQKIEAEFWELKMKEADIQGYTNRFYELSQLVPHMVTPEHRGIDRYIWGLIPQIRSNVIASRPSTMQSAISIANIMTDDLVRSGDLKKTEEKQELGNKRRRVGDQGNAEEGMKSGDGENQQAVQNYVAVVPERKTYTGPLPKCNKCSYHHNGACVTCSKCKKLGHAANVCKSGMFGSGTCFECGSPDHYRNNCPKLKQGSGSTTNPTR